MKQCEFLINAICSLKNSECLYVYNKEICPINKFRNKKLIKINFKK